MKQNNLPLLPKYRQTLHCIVYNYKYIHLQIQYLKLVEITLLRNLRSIILLIALELLLNKILLE